MTAAADISRALRVVETGGRMEAAEALALAGIGDRLTLDDAGRAGVPGRPWHARQLLARRSSSR